ncbi:hypothetical protein H0H93_003428, partial [Arthromyces matolae]
MKGYLVSSIVALVLFLLTRFHVGDAVPIPKPPQPDKNFQPIIPLVTGNPEGGEESLELSADEIDGDKINIPKTFLPEGQILPLWIPDEISGLESVINIMELMRTAAEGNRERKILNSWVYRVKRFDVWREKRVQFPRVYVSGTPIPLEGDKLMTRKRLIKEIVKRHNSGKWYDGDLEEMEKKLLKKNQVPPGVHALTMVSGQLHPSMPHISALAMQGVHSSWQGEHPGSDSFPTAVQSGQIHRSTPQINAPMQGVHSSWQLGQHKGSDVFPSPVQNTNTHNVHGGVSNPSSVTPWMNTPFDFHTTGGYQTGHAGGTSTYNQPIDMPAFLEGADHTLPTISGFPSNLQNIYHTHPPQPLGSESHSNTQLGVGYLAYDPSFDMGVGVPPARPPGGIPVGGLPSDYHSSPNHHQTFPNVQPPHTSVVHSQDIQHKQGQTEPL